MFIITIIGWIDHHTHTHARTRTHAHYQAQTRKQRAKERVSERRTEPPTYPTLSLNSFEATARSTRKAARESPPTWKKLSCVLNVVAMVPSSKLPRGCD